MERSCPIKMKPMKIHDKWYDMSDFDHPGGPIMLKLGESRDATALFESHHPFTSRKYLETILTKHEVKQDESCYLMDAKDKDDVFDWPEFESKNDSDAHAPVSEFAYELRTKVQNYFKSEAKRRGVPLIEATKGTPFRWVQITLMTMLFTSTLPGFLRGEWWTLFATPLTYWILGVNTFHDGSHFALSRDWRVNLVGTYVGWWFSSPFEWYHQHVIGHHAYPNMPNRDPDLYHNGTFERHTKTQRHKPLHRHQASTWPPIWFIGTLAMNYLKPIQMLTTGWYNRAVKMVQHTPARIQQHVAGRFFVFFLCHITPFLLHDSWFKAFLFSAIPVGLVSVCFMISSQVNHLTVENIDVEDKDFYKHQVITGHSFGGRDIFGWANFFFTGGLNLQIEHHLFPTVNHWHLPFLKPIVMSVCKKHDVFYHESSGLIEALGKYHKHMVSLSCP